METQTYNYKVVRPFAIMTVGWGIVGMLVGVIAAAQLRWPELNLSEIAPWFHFGRIRPLHTNAVIFAFGGSGLFAVLFLVKDDAAGAGLQAETRCLPGDGDAVLKQQQRVLVQVEGSEEAAPAFEVVHQ